MRVTINKPDGVVGVNGIFRSVDLSALPAGMRVLHFDTVAGVGRVEYDDTVTTDVDARDFDAERAAEAAAGSDPVKIAALVPIFKRIAVPLRHVDLSDFSPYQAVLDAWTAAAPPPPAPSPAYDWDDAAKVWVLNPVKQAELDRLGAIDTTIAQDQIGTATPKSIADLKAMSAAEYSAWFDANFDTAAKLIGLLKRLTLIVIRRVL